MKPLVEYKLPGPGSFTWSVMGPNDPANHIVWTVVSAREVVYPGTWTQYYLHLLGNGRLLNIESEQTDFHNNWHVLVP